MFRFVKSRCSISLCVILPPNDEGAHTSHKIPIELKRAIMTFASKSQYNERLTWLLKMTLGRVSTSKSQLFIYKK